MASLPADVGSGIVRVRLRQVGVTSATDGSVDVTPVTGRVVFTPSTSMLRHTGQGLLFPSFPVSVYLNADGDADAVLMATNDPQIEPINWTYTVSFVLEGSLHIDSFSISVPEGSDRELSDIVPVPDADGTFYLNYGVGLSTDPNNYAVLGTDGKIYVPIPSGGGGSVDPADLLSADAGNYAGLGTDGKIYVVTPTTPVLAHSGLTGLTSGDDHTQYLNNTRGDARYYTKSQTDSQIAANIPTWTTLSGKPSTFTPSTHTHAANTVTFTPSGDITATDVQAAVVQAAGLAYAASSGQVLVCKYASGAYPTLPATIPAGVKVVSYYGPTAPTSLPSWIGTGAGQALGEYTYAALT